MKYSINSSGYIVAERDIYSLGGFIPKGSVGAKVANEDQISQDGECWVAGGNISARPDIRVKDNAYIGDFVGTAGMYTDGVTEFSGNTLIPGKIIVQNLLADTKNDVFIKDSFIGVSMDVLCGSATTTTAFPFEQGDLKKEAAKGTLFTSASMRLEDASACRSTDTLRLGRNTYLYIPTGYRARVFWAYYDTSNQLAYSGESTVVAAGLTKFDHPVYKLAVVSVVKIDGTAMTPTNLLATGAKIIGHISGSLSQDFRPESASGQYVMDNSSFISNTDNFGLAAIQLRYLAGSMYDTNVYIPGGSTDYKIFGTFHNVQRLEYTKYLPGSRRTAATRDTYISAYGCPLLRVDDNTYNDALAAKGNLVLRRCVVPKAAFAVDKVDGNTYEGIDFSYTNEFMGTKVSDKTYVCSHKQGLYTLYSASGSLTGRASYPDNAKNATSLTEERDMVLLDGDIIEQGSYTAAIGQFYEEGKGDTVLGVRTGKPVSTSGLSLPSLPSGYVLGAAHYLDNEFKFANSVAYPQSIDENYPFVVFVVNKDPSSEVISASEFIALNVSLTVKDYTKVPEITGSAYVGTGCIIRGDVQLHGDPYVNRVFDVNMWERGTGDSVTGDTWEGLKRPESVGYPRLRTRDVFPVDTTVDNNFTCASGYRMLIYYFGEDGKCSGWSSWGASLSVSDPAVAYISVLVSKDNGTDFIEDSDIPLANVKYLRAFKKRRYITNELDRTSPEDILLRPDKWDRLYLNRTAGKKYSELRYANANGISLNTPINVPASATVNVVTGYVRAGVNLDALLVCLTDALTPPENVALQGFALRKDPAAAILPSGAPDARLIIDFTPSPRIVVPYGSSTLLIRGLKIRMYDNAVLSRNLDQRGEIVLLGDAVMGYDFNSGSCMCSNGHSDAIIKLP